MTLTEFLLARIAEDEERATMAGKSPVGWSYFANESAGLDYYLGWYLMGHSPRRAVSDAATQRLMVERLTAMDSPEMHVDAWTVAKWTMRMMAQSYSNHPDYRQEWKP